MEFGVENNSLKQTPFQASINSTYDQEPQKN
jgi:hypothetical protein